MENLQLEHTSRQLKLFFVSFMIWVKAMLLCNGNKFSSVPLVQAVRMKETHDYLLGLLQKLRH